MPSCEDPMTGAVVSGIAAGERVTMAPVEWNDPDVINLSYRVDDALTEALPLDARVCSWSEIARRSEDAPDGRLQPGGHQ